LGRFEKVNSIKRGIIHAKTGQTSHIEVVAKTKPPLGWPRSTDSLCPKCVPEIAADV